MNMMAAQPGAPFHFPMEADDNMEISSPHMFHDQDIDIDLELGDGEEVVGEDENMLEDAPTDELAGMTGQAQPALVDDEMADDAPTPRPEIQTSFAFGPSDFNTEANDLDLLDDGEDYPFGGYQDTDPSQGARLVNEYIGSANIFPELPLASDTKDAENSLSRYGNITSEYALAELEPLEEVGNTTTLQTVESELSREQPTVPTSAVDEQFTTTPVPSASLDPTDKSIPEPVENQTRTMHESLDGTVNLDDEATKQGMANSVTLTEQEEPHFEQGAGHYQPEGELDEDGSSEEDDTVPPLHPVAVKYQNEEMSLFQSKESEVEHSPTFLLQDQALASQSILDLLNACRDVLAGSVDTSEELCLGMDDLGLDFCETTPESSTTSLSEVLDIYLQLCFNDGTEYPEPLSTSLTTKPRLAQRLELLRSTATDGGSLSAIDYTSNSGEPAYEERDDEHQSVHGTANQPSQEQESTQPTGKAGDDNVAANFEETSRRYQSRLEENQNDDTEYPPDNKPGTETSAAEIQRSDKVIPTPSLSRESPGLHSANPQNSHGEEHIEKATNPGLGKDKGISNQQPTKTDLKNGPDAHVAEDSPGHESEDLKSDIEQDFELDFDETTGTTDAPSDLPAQVFQDAATTAVGRANPEDSEPQIGTPRRGSSSGSSTVKGDTTTVEAFVPVEYAKSISGEPQPSTTAFDGNEPHLDVANRLGILENNGEEDELSWEEDGLPSHAHQEADDEFQQTSILDIQDANALGGKDAASPTSKPVAESNGASSSTELGYEEDEITYDDEEFDAPLPKIEKITTPRLSQSPKGSPVSAKRGRSSDGELDHDRFDGQEAKRVKSM